MKTEYNPIIPVLDRVLVKPLELETTTKSGLIIPDNINRKSTEGVIVSIGHGYKKDDGSFIPLVVKVGDKVIYNEYDGVELSYKEQKYLVLLESQIIAVMGDYND